MFKRLLAWLTGKKSSTPSGFKLNRTSRADLATVNADELTPAERAAMPEAFSQFSGIPHFSGKVDHVYDLSTISSSEQCPRCGTPTRQQYAEWVYATNRGPRAMMAPAGYFCGKCPSVIIDQEMVKAGTTRGFRFVQVIGLTDARQRGFQGFKTWNGGKTVYLFDENQMPTGIASLNDLSPEERQHLRRPSESTKRKRWKVKRK